MRQPTSDQAAALFASDRQTTARVRVADPSGALVDYTVAGGASTDWVDSFRVSANVDQMAATATVTMFRETDAGSLAPYLAPGSEAIKAGRRFTLEVAPLAYGASVGSGDWWLLFDGYIDDVEWGGRSGLTFTGRDVAGLLLDAWVVGENTYGSAVSPVEVQTVIQQILDEAFSGSVTFTTVGDPDLGIVAYTQRMQSVADAVKALTDLNGWVFRPVWSGMQTAPTLTLYEPARNQTSPIYTITPSDYYDIPGFGESSTNIRNYGVIKWGGGTVTAQDDTSIAEYGRRRYIVLNASQDTQINSEAKAIAFITAVVSDLSQPLATQQAVLPIFPPVDINDFYRFTPNNVHYSGHQDMAVVAYEHYWGPDGSSTTLSLRGAPTGGVTRWNSVRNRLEDDTVPEAEDPVLAEDDIQFYYTTASGSVGFANAGTAAGSLGGWASITRVSEAVNGIFRKVSETERTTSVDLYRSIAVVNESTSPVPLDWECVKAWLDLTNLLSGGGVTWEIAFDPQGIYPAAQLYSCISPDESTAPVCSPPLTFVSPSASDASDVLGGTSADTIPGGGYGRIIHIHLMVGSGAATQTTNDDVVFQSQVPASS